MSEDNGVYVTQDVEQIANMTRFLLSVWDKCREASRDELISAIVNDGGYVSLADNPFTIEDLMMASTLSAAIVLTMEHLQVSSRESRWILFGNTVDQKLTFTPNDWLIEAIEAINDRAKQEAIDTIPDQSKN